MVLLGCFLSRICLQQQYHACQCTSAVLIQWQGSDIVDLPPHGWRLCPCYLSKMPRQLSLAFKRSKSTLLECLLKMGMGEVHAHLFGIFPKRMYPLCPVFLCSQQGHCLRGTAYLCVLHLGQLICLLIPQKGRTLWAAAWYTVTSSFSSFPRPRPTFQLPIVGGAGLPSCLFLLS